MSILTNSAIKTEDVPGPANYDIQIAGNGGISIQITGTFVGTISFYGSVDGVNFLAMQFNKQADGTLVTTTTAPGIFTGPVNGLTLVRVAFTTYTSGSAVVTYGLTRDTITLNAAA